MKCKNLPQDHVVLVCAGSCCKKNGSKKLFTRLRQLLEEVRLRPAVRLQKCKCMGRCGKGPSVMTFPDGRVYTEVKNGDAATLIAELRAGCASSEDHTFRKEAL